MAAQVSFRLLACHALVVAATFAGPVWAQDFPGLRPRDPGHGGKLLLTGGVSTVEGAAGGGLVPWALIGGYGTRDQVGGNVFVTRVTLDTTRSQRQARWSVSMIDSSSASLDRLSIHVQSVRRSGSAKASPSTRTWSARSCGCSAMRSWSRIGGCRR